MLRFLLINRPAGFRFRSPASFFTLFKKERQDIIGPETFAKEFGLFLLDMKGMGGKEIGMGFFGFFAISGFYAAGLDGVIQKVPADIDLCSKERLAGSYDIGLVDRCH
jgi:hypothetical protein